MHYCTCQLPALHYPSTLHKNIHVLEVLPLRIFDADGTAERILPSTYSHT